MKSFTLIVLLLCGLSAVRSQSSKYILRLGSEFEVHSIIEVVDPYSQTWDTIWSSALGDTGKDKTLRLNSKNTSVLFGNVVVPYLEDLFIDSGGRSFANKQISNEMKSVLRTADKVYKWIFDYIRDKKGRWRTIRMQYILDSTFPEIMAEAVPDYQAENLLMVQVLTNLFWQAKMIIFLKKPDEFSGFLLEFHKSEPFKQEFWTASNIMGMMRIASYVELRDNGWEFQGLIKEHEHNITENPGKMYYVYKYASLLYVLNTKFNTSMAPVDQKVKHVEIDTALIYFPEVYSLEFVRKLMRSGHHKINVNESVYVSEFDKNRLSEIIHKDLIVIDFWGTWCKPCIENLPALNQAAFQYQDVQFVSLAVDKMKNWIRYLKRHPNDNIECALIDGDVRAVYSIGVNVFPTYLIMNMNGDVLFGPVHTIENLTRGLQGVLK